MPAAKMEPKQVADLHGGSETILMDEDDDAVKRLTTKMLYHHGYRIIEAVDGQHVVEKYIEFRDSTQLVILDLIMPKKNSKVAYDEIKKAEVCS